MAFPSLFAVNDHINKKADNQVIRSQLTATPCAHLCAGMKTYEPRREQIGRVRVILCFPVSKHVDTITAPPTCQGSSESVFRSFRPGLCRCLPGICLRLRSFIIPKGCRCLLSGAFLCESDSIGSHPCGGCSHKKRCSSLKSCHGEIPPLSALPTPVQHSAAPSTHPPERRSR